MSEAASRKDKSGMIESAKKIAGMLGKIQEFSGDIATKCTDPILKERLLSLCKVCTSRNFIEISFNFETPAHLKFPCNFQSHFDFETRVARIFFEISVVQN